jgi:hypothetical protein
MLTIWRGLWNPPPKRTTVYVNKFAHFTSAGHRCTRHQTADRNSPLFSFRDLSAAARQKRQLSYNNRQAFRQLGNCWATKVKVRVKCAHGWTGQKRVGWRQTDGTPFPFIYSSCLSVFPCPLSTRQYGREKETGLGQFLGRLGNDSMFGAMLVSLSIVPTNFHPKATLKLRRP